MAMLTLPTARSDASVILVETGTPATPLAEIYTWRPTWTAVIPGKFCGLVQLRVNPVLAVFKVTVTLLAGGGKYKRVDTIVSVILLSKPRVMLKP